MGDALDVLQIVLVNFRVPRRFQTADGLTDEPRLKAAIARRMGIKDHDEVLGVPWMRLYKCMEMDGLQREYERRLGEITRQDMERNNRRIRR